MLRRDLILLVTGFLLTTVVGGILGTFLQRRAWDHQFVVQGREREQERAEKVFEELSGLLDKRRYRMLRLYWYLKDADQKQGPTKEGEQRHRQYIDVLYQWNDGLNRRLALIKTHFSLEMHAELCQIYKKYKNVGELLDQAWTQHRAGNRYDVSTIGSSLDDLTHTNHNYALRALSRLMDGRKESDNRLMTRLRRMSHLSIGRARLGSVQDQDRPQGRP
jgi:hypothetical protein